MFKGSQLVVHSISESGLKPITSNAQLTEHTRDLKTVWNISHIMDIIKTIPEDDITFYMPPDSSNSFKVTSSSNGRFSYFAREANINETKYGPVTLESLT
jgi:DNA polymerase III sliding clamp (beta) subunit (PCNA family)